MERGADGQRQAEAQAEAATTAGVLSVSLLSGKSKAEPADTYPGRDGFSRLAAAILFAAYRTDAKPTNVKDDAARAIGDAAFLTDQLFPAEPK